CLAAERHGGRHQRGVRKARGADRCRRRLTTVTSPPGGAQRERRHRLDQRPPGGDGGIHHIGEASMKLSGLKPAERHRRIAATFTDRVQGTKNWDAPSPVASWTARDVVRHLVEWLPSFLAAGANVELPKGPSVDDDPVAAWQVHCDGVQAVLDDPQTPSRMLVNRNIGEVPLDRAIDQFYTSD